MTNKLPYNPETRIPLCPECGEELRISVTEEYQRVPCTVQEGGHIDYQVENDQQTASIAWEIHCPKCDWFIDFLRDPVASINWEPAS